MRDALIPNIVIPAKAAISSFPRRRESIGFLTVAKWIPAFAGMTWVLSG
jgi:hypothetical protein